MIDAPAVVLAFDEAINSRDVDALAGLMTDAHRFVDPSGATVHGRDACVEAWRGFFDTCPDYRNVFDEIAELGDGLVVVRGRSECSMAALEGPAEWRAACARMRSAPARR